MAAKLKPLPAPEPVERHTLSILVDNEAGMLGRITGPILAGARDLRGVTFLKPSGTADIGAYAFTGFQKMLLIVR